MPVKHKARRGRPDGLPVPGSLTRSSSGAGVADRRDASGRRANHGLPSRCLGLSPNRPPGAADETRSAYCSRVSPAPDRPLALGEIFAETVRLYGDRLWPALGLGAVYSGIVVLTRLVHPALNVVAAALLFVLTFGAATRLVIGDTFREAWAQVAVRLPVLLVLALVVGLPFILAVGYLFVFGLLFTAFWFGLTSFSVPAAVAERENDGRRWSQAVGFALERTIALARTEYLHATGVVAALLLVNLLFERLLSGALVGFADNTQALAVLLAQLVLAPFVFLGLSVLYFDQRARAISSPRQKT